MCDLGLITMKSDNIKDLSFTQAVQGALLVAGTVGIKILIAKALSVADDVSMLMYCRILTCELSVTSTMAMTGISFIKKSRKSVLS